MGASYLVNAKLRVPRGEDGFWSIIRDLDAKGPWTISDVAGNTSAQSGTVSGYCKRLRLGGYIEPAGERPHVRKQFGPSTLYRVAKPSLMSPRLDRDGNVRPETTIEILWRSIKMSSKNFTARELLAIVEEDGRTASLNSVRSYLQELCRADVIARTDGGKNAGKAGGGTAEAQYRLKRNLGGQAPKILASKIVFDPNTRSVLGQPIADEARP